jgi:hypothetical protein
VRLEHDTRWTQTAHRDQSGASSVGTVLEEGICQNFRSGGVGIRNATVAHMSGLIHDKYSNELMLDDAKNRAGAKIQRAVGTGW